LSSFDSQHAKDSQNAKIARFAVGVVGGNEGSRHVANVVVGGWHGEHRSVQRHFRVWPPRDTIVIWGAATREVGVGRCQFTVHSFQFPEIYPTPALPAREEGARLFAAIAIAKRLCAQRVNWHRYPFPEKCAIDGGLSNWICRTKVLRRFKNGLPLQYLLNSCQLSVFSSQKNTGRKQSELIRTV